MRFVPKYDLEKGEYVGVRPITNLHSMYELSYAIHVVNSHEAFELHTKLLNPSGTQRNQKCFRISLSIQQRTQVKAFN